MATAVAYCRHLLPLPPFAVWRQDFLRHRFEHLDVPVTRAGAGKEGPFPLGERTMASVAGGGWIASVHATREAGSWSGYIDFRSEDGREARTAEIFREESSVAVLERFDSFRDETLAAFLRSALP